MQTLLAITFAGSLALGFLMSGMEAGVFALSRLRIRHQMRLGNPRAKVLCGYLERPEDFLWTILVGNTVANFLVVSLGVVGLYHALGRWPAVLGAALVLGGAVFYSVSELLPKMLFRLYPGALCLATVLPFGVAHGVLRPLVVPLAWFSNRLAGWFSGRRFPGRLFGDRQELRHVLQESAQAMSGEERAMIQRVLNLQNLSLRQIAVPIAHVASANVRSTVRELLDLCRRRGFSRLPIWSADASGARVVGLVNVNRLLYQSGLDLERRAEEFVKPALFLDADARLEGALRQMQRTGQRLAIVVEPDRTELGIVCWPDLLKVIFGEVAF
ncbi:MAG: DUF21 domain-containing protein [Verrucomicrobia bacterium]|nr:DUF21 domain-containing protein [Verrucomicrobiota bacterium]